ncbi:alpha/beta-hydrolase [Exidia glandulosa HHB12029]|uniref:Alpha/beta-hydrolase n=1 Tax=Exidia glandulosa HHB12029 TaxID=1314781 RepID=A0A165K347_EXIGL|nr:alpha/beta-hydrolase [Exidia glandulosa HHB12029]
MLQVSFKSLVLVLLGATARAAVQVHDAQSFLSEPAPEAPSDFDWQQLKPSRSLDWHDCYTSFKCARFEVPLDWKYSEGYPRGSGGLAIAVIKAPSRYDQTDPRWRGPIFYNPGGPGYSGVDWLLQTGPNLTHRIGDEYDHVSFDPRGVSRSHPTIRYFDDEERAKWDEDRILGPSDVGLALARSQLIGAFADDPWFRGQGQGAFFVSTPSVALDVLAMARAYGREKVMYFGKGYGGILGLTMASMFPDKIERMVLDSVTDVNRYYDASYSTTLRSTDKALESFFISCSASKDCGIHNPTPEAVQARYERILASVAVEPVPWVFFSNYGIVDIAMTRATVFHALKHPYCMFPLLAIALSALEVGDGMYMHLLASSPFYYCKDEWMPGGLDYLTEARTAIMCRDAGPVDDSLAQLQQWFDRQRNVSSFADFAWSRIACAGWPSFGHQREFSGPFSGHTAHPILFLGSTADPLAPLSDAYFMSTQFPGSSVLAVESPGHGAFGLPSHCFDGHIKTYFRDGSLPANGTACAVDHPIQYCLEDSAAFGQLGADVKARLMKRRRSS